MFVYTVSLAHDSLKGSNQKNIQVLMMIFKVHCMQVSFIIKMQSDAV